MNPRILPTLLAGAATIAAAGLIIEWYQPAPAFPQPPVEAPAAEGPAPPPPPALLVVSQLEARPLFIQDRRPPKPPPAPVAVAAAPPPPAPPPPPPPPLPEADAGLTLLGIVNAPEGRIAIIRVKAGGEVVRATEGQAVDRWELRQISSNHVVLAIEGTTQELGFPSPTAGRSTSGSAHANNQQPHPQAPRPSH